MENSKRIEHKRTTPSSPKSSLIKRSRFAILAIAVIGVLSSVYSGSDEPEATDQPTTESTSRLQPKTLKNNDFPPPKSDLSEKRRKWKANFIKFMKALKEAEENKKYHLTAKEVIDPHAYSDYVEALVEENRNDFPRESKRLETAMGYLLDADSGFLDTNIITIADWKNMTQMLDDFDENNFSESAEELSRYFIAMAPTFGARSGIIYGLENGAISEDEATSLLLLTEDIESRDEVRTTIEKELETATMEVELGAYE